MEYIKAVIKTFIYVLCGFVISSALFITVLYPEAQLNYLFLWQMICMAAISSIGSLIYFSKREISKGQMRTRRVFHYIYVNLVVLGGAIYFGWINTRVMKQVIFMLVLIAVVFAGVSIVMFQKYEKEAENLNRKLSKIHTYEERDE